MIDTQDLRAQMNRGARVAAFMEDADILAVIHGLLDRYTADVMADNASPSWHRAKGLQEALQELESVVTTGKLAAQQLQGMKR